MTDTMTLFDDADLDLLLSSVPDDPADADADTDGDDDESWRLLAACADDSVLLDVFFPGRGGGAPRAAKRICCGCPVRTECLDYAESNDIVLGIWGGLDPRQRFERRKRELDGVVR